MPLKKKLTAIEWTGGLVNGADCVAVLSAWRAAGGSKTFTNGCDLGNYDDTPTVEGGRVTKIDWYAWSAARTLTGTLSSVIGSLKALRRLSLTGYDTGHNITGPIPESIVNLTELTYLVLAKNKLTGSIPTAIGNLNKLLYRLAQSYTHFCSFWLPTAGLMGTICLGRSLEVSLTVNTSSWGKIS